MKILGKILALLLILIGVVFTIIVRDITFLVLILMLLAAAFLD